MADYNRRLQSDNKHLQNIGSAKFAHLDGAASATIVPNTKGCSLLRVILNTNGAVITLRSGSRVVGIIATDAPEGPFPYGVWCENGLIAECSGAVDATVVFDSI